VQEADIRTKRLIEVPDELAPAHGDDVSQRFGRQKVDDTRERAKSAGCEKRGAGRRGREGEEPGGGGERGGRGGADPALKRCLSLLLLLVLLSVRGRGGGEGSTGTWSIVRQE